MMLNKHKYHIIKNFSYALHGLLEVFRNESSFRIEVYIFLILLVCIGFSPIPFLYKGILSTSMLIPLAAELANSAIERTVDLVTMKYDPKAKAAKDAGSALVFVSFIITGLIWFWTIFSLIFD